MMPRQRVLTALTGSTDWTRKAAIHRPAVGIATAHCPDFICVPHSGNIGGQRLQPLHNLRPHVGELVGLYDVSTSTPLR